MVSQTLRPLIIAGATGSGKSKLALKLALKFNGEIVCADSRQCYKYMAIGSAAPSLQELALVPHHGYGILDPCIQKMDVGFFINFTNQIIKDIQARKKRAIIVGGTGLYLRALRYGIIDLPQKDETLRLKLDMECENFGLKAMYEKLYLIDAESAKNIMPTDKFRILRALEIFLLTQKKPSNLRTNFSETQVKLKAHWFLLKTDKINLYQNLEKRIITMFDSGFLEEAVSLRKRLPTNHWALNTMGFREALLYADKKISFEQALNLILISHRQYAKRQATWFKKENFYLNFNRV